MDLTLCVKKSKEPNKTRAEEENFGKPPTRLPEVCLTIRLRTPIRSSCPHGLVISWSSHLRDDKAMGTDEPTTIGLRKHGNRSTGSDPRPKDRSDTSIKISM
jgi:hypothetical protein